MAAPYVFYDPKSPPPLMGTVIWVVFLLGVLFFLFWWNDTFDASPDKAGHVSAAPTHGWLHGNDASAKAPRTVAEMTAVMKDARRSVSSTSPMNIARPAHVAESFEGFSFTGMHWCTATDYGTLRSVLQVSFTTEGVFGFALGTTDGPVPKAYSMPAESMGDVGIVGFDNPDMRRLYVALSGSPEVDNGWKVLGYVDLPAPLSVDWCGYGGVFRITYPDGHVEGRAYVLVHDPTEDPLH